MDRKAVTSRDNHEQAGTIGKSGAIVLSLLFGGLLLGLAAPRLVTQYLMLSGDPVLSAIEKGREVSADELRRLILSRQRGLTWADSGPARVELAIAQILLAEREVGGGARYHELMQQAVASLRDGLAQAPADPFAWTRLAYADLAEAAPARRVVPILAMAIETAPVQPTLVFPRLELCLMEWPYFARAHPALFTGQLRVAWREDPRRLVRLARLAGRTDAVREALVDDDRRDFDRLAQERD